MGFLYFLIGLAAYFAPSTVAFVRHAENKWRVFVVNLTLGWSVVGWIVALVMALPGHGQHQVTTVTVHNTVGAAPQEPPAPVA